MSAGAVSESRVESAIASADAEIDGLIGGRYTLPLDPVPAILRDLSVDIAVYNLYSRRMQNVPDNRLLRYQQRVAFLKLVATGTATLGPADPSADPGAAQAPQMSEDNPERIFDRTKMGDF